MNIRSFVDGLATFVQRAGTSGGEKETSGRDDRPPKGDDGRNRERTEIARWADESIPANVEGLILTANGSPIRLVPTGEDGPNRASIDDLLDARREWRRTDR